MILSDLGFLQIGLVLTALVAAGFLGHARRRRRLGAFLGGRHAARRVFREDLYRHRGWRLCLLLGAGLALSLAAGGVAIADPPPEPPEPVIEVILAIDVSASMQAPDVAPTRLARATEVARRVVASLEDAEIGLVLFAGTSYPVAPPTADHDALLYLLEGVTPTLASSTDPGTRISAGILAGAALFGEAGAGVGGEGEGDGDPGGDGEEDGPAAVGSEDGASPATEPHTIRSIVLIGDGDSEEPGPELDRALDVVRERGITVHGVGVGTPEGSTMTMPAGRYQLGGPVLDPMGAPAVSRLREALMRDVAGRAGGIYRPATGGDAEAAVVDAIEQARVTAADTSEPAGQWAGMDLPLLLGTLALLVMAVEGLLTFASLRNPTRGSDVVEKPVARA